MWWYVVRDDMAFNGVVDSVLTLTAIGLVVAVISQVRTKSPDREYRLPQ